MLSYIKYFCENIFNYEYLSGIKKNDRKILNKFIKKSLEKYKYDKTSIYYRRAYIMDIMFTNKNKTYKFFFSIFNQPYLNDYVFNPDLKEIKKFIKSEYDLYDTVMYIKKLTRCSEYFNHLTFNILKSTNSVCISPRLFYTYKNKDVDFINRSKIKKYNTKLTKINGFTFLTDIDLNMYLFDFSNRNKYISERPILINKSERLYNMMINNKIKTKKCIDDAKNGLIRFVYYEINWVIEQVDEIKYFKFNSSEDTMFHRSNVILDFVNYNKTKIVDVIYMETSIEDTCYSDIWVNVENILLDSIKNDIVSNLELECNIITFDSEDCPRVNIQGSYGTCALWSIYLFYLYIFYPSRKEIFSILYKIDIRSRNDILLFFIFFVYKTCKDKIKRVNRIPSIDIDIELSENCTLLEMSK